jgi:nicotinamide-nucleotide amidase
MTSELAAAVLDGLRAQGRTLATAESLTGGGLGARLTSVPGASASYAGGVIGYATRLKVDLLGVPIEIIYGDGAVSAPCARAMAVGVRRLLGADMGVATTGVAGPDLQEGKPAGTVFVAVADAGGEAVRALRLEGDRDAIRAATTEAALDLLLSRISANP